MYMHLAVKLFLLPCAQQQLQVVDMCTCSIQRSFRHHPTLNVIAIRLVMLTLQLASYAGAHIGVW